MSVAAPDRAKAAGATGCLGSDGPETRGGGRRRFPFPLLPQIDRSEVALRCSDEVVHLYICKQLAGTFYLRCKGVPFTGAKGRLVPHCRRQPRAVDFAATLRFVIAPPLPSSANDVVVTEGALSVEFQ